MENSVSASKALITVFLGILILGLSQGIASMIDLFPITKIISSILYALIYIVVAYWGVKLLSKKALNLPLKACRIDRVHIERKWLTCGIILPSAVLIILV